VVQNSFILMSLNCTLCFSLFLSETVGDILDIFMIFGREVISFKGILMQ
jgi:hypothetical protein